MLYQLAFTNVFIFVRDAIELYQSSRRDLVVLVRVINTCLTEALSEENSAIINLHWFKRHLNALKQHITGVTIYSQYGLTDSH